MPRPSAQEAGFKPATYPCFKWGTGPCAELYQEQLCSRRESSLLVSEAGQADTLGARLALSLRLRELLVEVVRFSQQRLEGSAGRPGGAAGPAGCPLHPNHGSPVPLSWFSVGEAQEPEDILLSGSGKHSARPHLETSGVPHHSCAEGMLRQAHALGLGQGPHGTVEVGRAGEVEQGACKLAVGHNDDVQSSVPSPWSWELAYTQVLLLLTILLLAHQVISQEPWPNIEGLLGGLGARPWAIPSSQLS